MFLWDSLLLSPLGELNMVCISLPVYNTQPQGWHAKNHIKDTTEKPDSHAFNLLVQSAYWTTEELIQSAFEM